MGWGLAFGQRRGLSCLSLRLLRLVRGRFEGLTVIDGSTRKERHRDKGEERDGEGGGGS